VADLVGRSAALIAATGGVASALVPVVFAMGADPVRFGLVASLNRPGGNITGVSYLANTILEKQIEMLHESVSRVTPIGFLVNPANPNAEQDMRTATAASRAFGLSSSRPVRKARSMRPSPPWSRSGPAPS
jgi:putative ABC transport system substrate-binding protein